MRSSQRRRPQFGPPFPRILSCSRAILTAHSTRSYEIITNGEECIIEGNLVLAYPLLAALAGSTVVFGLVLCCCGFVTCKGGKDKPGNMH